MRVTPHLNFCAASKDAEKYYYYESCRMALLAYVAFPNAVWGTSYELMNTISDETAERILRAFAADEPRSDLPPQARPWSDCPAFLRAKWNGAKDQERRDTLAGKKIGGLGPSFCRYTPHPSVGSLGGRADVRRPPANCSACNFPTKTICSNTPRTKPGWDTSHAENPDVEEAATTRGGAPA